MAQRWRKHGGRAVQLPEVDRDAAGLTWTSLADNPEGREACGWTPAEVPELVSMSQARAALRDAGLLAEIDAWVAEQDEEIQLAWRTGAVIRRHTPTLLAAAEAKGLSAEQLDDLFFAAEAAPDPQRKF